tara:strand:+ start:578 stop:709 length:132 start_codon:yes stop_codon:yes gene_type:complete
MLIIYAQRTSAKSHVAGEVARKFFCYNRTAPIAGFPAREIFRP